MSTLSLRWRIALWSALVSALALLTFTAILAFSLYGEQVEAIDARLAGSAALVRTHDQRSIDALAAITPAATPANAEKDLFGFALLRTGNGALLHAQPPALAKAFGQWPQSRWPPPRKFFMANIEGRRLRVAAAVDGDTTLLLAASLEPADEAVRDLLGAAALALPLVLLVVTGGSWWIARRALAPIAAITKAAASITADRLGERLPAPQTADEIGRHTEVLNDMFDRLQRGFEQATRFTADAAHELRTPLTIMRGQVEEQLRSAPPEQESLLIGLLEEITGLQRISDTLLLLARFDAGKNPLHRRPLDWSALVEEAGEDAGLLAHPGKLTVTTAVSPGISIAGDAVMLRRLALNLIDNAVKFNRPGGEVRLALRADDTHALLTVGNSGPGIAPERRASLFERFYRGASDHNRETGGSGLGLSLCREIVRAHDGTIELARADDDWTEFSVRLPRVLPGPDSKAADSGSVPPVK
jgi:signal transduction histidine kinase